MGFFDKLKNEAAAAVSGAVKQAAANAVSKTEKIVFSDLPESLEAFKALPQAALTTPFDTAALAVAAFCIFTTNKELCYEMIDFSVVRDL